MKKTDPNQGDGPPNEPASAESRRDTVARLFDEHNESLIRFLRLRLRSDEEAKEVAQEAYVRLLQLDRPEAVSYFRAFLFKTAANIAIDRLRRTTLDRKHATLTSFDEVSPSAEQTQSQQEMLRLVGECLEELPPKCRKAFLLSRIYGLSTAEIAAQMRLTPRMIRTYLVRATVHCQGRLGGGHGEQDDS